MFATLRPTMGHRMRLLAALAAALLTVGGGVARADAPPPTLPPATSKSVAKELLIPMDDGVRLAATVTFPSADGTTPLPGRFPVVLQTTPYGRTGLCGCFAADTFATRGIISAVVDVRGTGGSEGTLAGNYFSPREARDGAALIEYFGTQPYSSGKVGMTGGSYLGITEYLAAEQQPAHLAAIAPEVALSDLYRDAYTHGGIVNLSFDLQYIAVQGAPGSAGANTDPSLLQATLAAKLGQSPPGTIAFDYLARPDDDAFYRDRSPITHADRITVPVLDLGQWHDGLLRGEPEMYRVLSRRPGVETRLYMDPCTHKGCGAPFAPFTNPPGQADTTPVIFEFLAKYLLDRPTPPRPNVRFFLQGANRYVDADRWPPQGTGYERLVLAKDGAMSAGAPTSDMAGTASYVTDPAAGFSMAFDDYGTVAASPYVPLDQRLEGPQGLTWRGPLLTAPLTLTGPLLLHLSAASSATDTDWYAKVADVAPDGTESIITEGALRASHRALDPARSTPERPYHTHVAPTPIEPGRYDDYDVEIWQTAYQLAPGHRLQVRLTSTDLPTHLPGTIRLDRDHPEDTQIALLPPATNTVRLGQSWLQIPVAGAAPASTSAAAAPARCTAVRHVALTLRGLPRHARVLAVRVTSGARRVAARRSGRRLRLTLRGAGRRVRVVVRYRIHGRSRTLVVRRAFPACAP